MKPLRVYTYFLGLVAVSLAAQVKAGHAEFYAGKQLSVVVGSGVGGGYDLYARLLARHYGRHVPGNPTLVVKNMPGGGGLTQANYLYNAALPDGLTIGMMQNTLPLNQLGNSRNVKFDFRKFGWIGNLNVLSTTCALSSRVEVKRPQDLKGEILIGNTGGSTSMIPMLLNNLAGMQFKMVEGYPSTGSVLLAIERGEVNGVCGWGWDGARVLARDHLERGILKIHLDIAKAPHPELRELGVPFLLDLIPDGEEKSVLSLILGTQVYGRPIAAPPKTPEDRLAVLRTAFEAMVKDPEFLVEVEKSGQEVRAQKTDEFTPLINEAFQAPEKIQNRAIEELKRAGFVF
jgi:tripartite-type tricarboxylate transporter receptor subunit TctC